MSGLAEGVGRRGGEGVGDGFFVIEPDKAAAKDLLLAASQESQAGRIPGFWGSEAERLLAPLNVAAPESPEAPQVEAPESSEE